jgi:hypothetical protein
MGPPLKLPGVPMPAATQTGRPTAAGPQPTSIPLIPPLCQKVVASFNQLYPALTVQDLCTQGKVKFAQLKIGKFGACINFGFLGQCPGCKYRHKVCSVPDSRWAAVVKVLESAMANMKAATAPCQGSLVSIPDGRGLSPPPPFLPSKTIQQRHRRAAGPICWDCTSLCTTCMAPRQQTCLP